MMYAFIIKPIPVILACNLILLRH